jgi:hypothetical protein
VPITFDQFLKHILRVPPAWSFQEKSRIKAIVSTKRYQDMQQRYTARIHNETERYHPFTELVNHAMEKLRAQNKFVVSFCRNDPIIIKGSHAQRKPKGKEKVSTTFPKRDRSETLSLGSIWYRFWSSKSRCLS